ncbi:sodium:proton antiporter [Methylosinus sp. H3A]|uniref:cation:proton antiporter n=1 Tax=Methylosinus sp. H3A TaxID=2785786 RepID=UPI0018C2C518|nr:sodium:proton antiporter [Methylosinus sp. H3A]MBG0808018.1 sodium:proton antiporter [Methylosinus sp. H3A]
MTVFEITAAILTLTAVGGYLNQKYLQFPATIGMMAFSFLISLIALLLDKMGWMDLSVASAFVGQIDFSEVLLHGMLSFLLFAGALHINFDDLNNVKWPVAVLATFGVVASTFITGTLVWWGADLVGLRLHYLYALLFGALISPTDPIAVLSILREAGISKRLYVKIGAESLFNDGIGVVVFLTILGLATGAQELEFSTVALLLVREAFGGAVLGLLLGWITYRLLRSIDSYKVEVLLTLALATGGYVIADLLHVSGPIYIVTAGLVVGNHGRNFGMSELTRTRLDDFWELLDEILNGVLFILIGLEVIVITITKQHILLGGMAIAAVLSGRIVSVGAPISFVSPRQFLDWRMIGLLTWGGLRGGLSIAMALALPAGPEKSIILPITYIVVLFSILVQGLTFQSSLKFLVK